MNKRTTNSTALAIKWSLISLVTSILFTYAFQYLDVRPNSNAKYITYVPFIAFLFLTQYEYKVTHDKHLPFGKGFSCGFLYSVFTAVLTAIFLYLYFTVLSPEVVEKMLANTQDKLEAKGSMSQDQIDKAMSFSKNYFAVFGAIGSILVYTILGTIFSLIGATIFKQEELHPDEIAL